MRLCLHVTTLLNYSSTAMIITQQQLKAIVPNIKPANLQVYTEQLNIYMPQYGIDTLARITPFLANLAHESGSFNYTREIASGAAYEGRKDLGNVHPGDGKKFRGRGLIQITGRGNYKWCSMGMYGDDRLLEQPELLEQPGPATQSACWFWAVAKKLNDVADKPDDYVRVWRGKKYSRFEWIVLLINGGQNGLTERKAFYARALAILQ